MNMYITSGTYDFLDTMKKKHPDLNLIMLQGGPSALLIQETEGKSIFKEPRKYEVVESIGELRQNGFIAMNSVPVTEEDRTTFEHTSKSNELKASRQPGFVASRILRPIKSETYIILTQWTEESAFNDWQSTKEFLGVEDPKEKSLLVNPQSLFSGRAILNKYYVLTEKQ
ncbi:antibiotic biosynthesis monooxygenase family protein [Bacillus testis]|uniref:antibiotic biosynthesis monooxygenase family protein n=1 Tax=Bacillus testis TaxID=1622072 RepID=UPI00067F2519|nr:antibiotic biosynthesis monooxygenase [Bacillus testis]